MDNPQTAYCPSRLHPSQRRDGDAGKRSIRVLVKGLRDADWLSARLRVSFPFLPKGHLSLLLAPTFWRDLAQPLPVGRAETSVLSRFLPSYAPVLQPNFC